MILFLAAQYLLAREERKGQFRKRVVLANDIMYPRSGFWVPGNIQMYPRSGFWYRGTSAKTTVLESALLRTPIGCG